MDNSKSPSEVDFSLILASSVHDMKNSLGMLMHSLEELCEQLPKENDQGLSASTIRYEAERVNNDLIQLLGVYRLQRKTMTAHIDEHYLDDILAEQNAQYSEVFKARGIELSIDCSSSLAWYFDRELLSGIINNALNNASRYSNKCIKLKAYETELNGHTFLEINVNDDGDGYPEDILKLDPSDIQNNLNFKTGSTSLGLYFASKVAALHQQNEHIGEIRLSNGGDLNGGVFRLLLP